FGIRSLFFPWLGAKNQAEYGHYVFQDLGHLTEAQRWVFEAMVGWTETAPLLNYLVEYNIAMGRPRVADKFLVMLEQTLFYRDRARYLRSCLEQGQVPGLRWALADAPSEPARWNNMLNVGGEASFILTHDPDNEMARQYLMTGMLLVNNPEAVFRTLERIYPADEHPELPRIVQEALLMYRLSYGHAAINSLGYNISEENEKRFRDYMTESAKGKKARYTPDQRRSYWYYVEHVFPKVNHDFTRNKKPQVQS
ncbi:MAG: hypothetical protein K2M97_04315, partial [Muribaculaceae bacterium]|nr:hypothetical protein [Muribaculaceae bacterium]